jgi:hypothetical protein
MGTRPNTREARVSIVASRFPFLFAPFLGFSAQNTLYGTQNVGLPSKNFSP